MIGKIFEAKKKFKFTKFYNERKKFLKKHADKSFVIGKGSGVVMLSAPHGVEHVRMGKPKFKEPGSLALMLEVQKLTGAHYIAKTKNLGDDANYEEVCPYKEELIDYIQKNNIKYLIDFHGLKKTSGFDINLGTYLGQNIKNDEAMFDELYLKLKDEGFVVTVDSPYWGGVRTVSGAVAKRAGIWTLQMEINYKYTSKSEYTKRLLAMIEILVTTIDRINEKYAEEKPNKKRK